MLPCSCMENMLLRLEGLRGVLNAGQRVREVKLFVHVWTCSEELETVDTFVAELSKHDYDSALSRAEMFRLATMEWLMERQVRTRWLRINTTFIAFCGNTCIPKYSVNPSQGMTRPRHCAIPTACVGSRDASPQALRGVSHDGCLPLLGVTFHI